MRTCYAPTFWIGVIVLVSWPLGACGDPLAGDPPGTGRLEVRAQTTNAPSDPTLLYSLTLRAGTAAAPGEPIVGYEDVSVQPTGVTTISGLEPGMVTMTLTEVPDGCTIDGGPTRDVTVVAGERRRATYQIACP